MELLILGLDSITLSVKFDEKVFIVANNISQLKGAGSSCTFYLNTPLVNSTYLCIIDMDEISAFYDSLSSFLSLKSDSALFSSHDDLFYLKFERNDGSIQCEYSFNQFTSPKTSVKVLFSSDEIQAANCKKELNFLFNSLNNTVYDKRFFTKWW